MQNAIYRRMPKDDDLRLSLPGNDLDFASLDAAAERKWGRGPVRIASWIMSPAPANKDKQFHHEDKQT